MGMCGYTTVYIHVWSKELHMQAYFLNTSMFVSKLYKFSCYYWDDDGVIVGVHSRRFVLYLRPRPAGRQTSDVATSRQWNQPGCDFMLCHPENSDESTTAATMATSGGAGRSVFADSSAPYRPLPLVVDQGPQWQETTWLRWELNPTSLLGL